MPRFSIVVPAYNVEKYVEECLDSILTQTFKDFEVICVDDASTDKTALIIKSYVAHDRRVHLINNEQNVGVFASRHIGARATRGEYLLFVDGDDALVPNALEYLSEKLQESPVDILQFSMQVCADKSKKVRLNKGAWYFKKSEPRFLEGQGLAGIICYEQPDDMCIHHRVYNGDLARSVLHELGYERDLSAQEDMVELIALMISAQSYQTIDTPPLYIYYIGRGMSTSHSKLNAQEFIFNMQQKYHSYKTLIDYLNRRDEQNVNIRVPVEWRWRYACTQALYEWHESVVPEQRLKAFEGYAKLWPTRWLLPSLYSFLEQECKCLLSVNAKQKTSQITFARMKRDFLIDLQCLLCAFIIHDKTIIILDEPIAQWRTLLTDLVKSDFLHNDSKSLSDDVCLMLQCVCAMCVFQKNETWLIDDFTTKARFEEAYRRQQLELEQNQQQAKLEQNRSLIRRVLSRVRAKLSSASQAK